MRLVSTYRMDPIYTLNNMEDEKMQRLFKLVCWLLFAGSDFCLSLYCLQNHVPQMEYDKIFFVVAATALAGVAALSLLRDNKEVFLVTVLIMVGNCLQYGFDNSQHYVKAIVIGFVVYVVFRNLAKREFWTRGYITGLLMAGSLVFSGIIMKFGKDTQFMGFQIALTALAFYPVISDSVVNGRDGLHMNRNLNSIQVKYLILSAYTAILSLLCIKQCEYASMLIILILYLNTIFFNVRDLLFKVVLLISGTGFTVYTILTRQHIRDRFNAWIHFKTLVNNRENGKIASVRYLYQNMRRAGFYGVGIRNSSNRSVVPTIDNDHIAQVVIQEWGLVLAVILTGIYVLLFVMMLRNCRNRHTTLIQNTALTVMLSFILSVAGTLGVFIIAGITVPWIGDGVNLFVLNMICLALCKGTKNE